ncbi:IS1182 family transposase, partial [Brevifollis gellanilyticus]|uniref:IS1182 family transposase n=1 Tax=Brevifollis gellanilyticus TaxID=748831 RepID=UPI0011BFA663
LDRDQIQMLPPCVEDYVHAEAPVRFIDAYVDGLDLTKLGFARSLPKATGRPAYHPGDLLKLYLYGYLNRLRSSRRLEAEATRNLELIWLLRSLRPDFKTIADFRKDNRAAFKGVFREFNLLCRKLELFGAELVAIDGSKFKALSSPQRQVNAAQLREILQRIDERIEAYLRDLDTQDNEAASSSSSGGGDGDGGAGLQKKIQRLRQSRAGHVTLLEELEQSGRSEVSLNDADARMMHDKQRGGYMPGYNVQAAVDTRHDLIIVQDVVQNANDRGELAAMAVAAKEELQVSSLAVVADKGYHEAMQLEACEQAGIEAYVPAQRSTSGRSSKDGRAVFGKELFRYVAETNVYHCPAGERLKYRAKGTCRGKEVLHYANAVACAQCALKEACTSGKHRSIRRLPNEAVVERAAQRLAQRKDMAVLRRQSVEHVFGTLKEWGHGAFLMRGLEKVRAEFSLSALAYNLRRALNVKGVRLMMDALA